MNNRRPLEGITVVALEQAVAGPYATRQLGDLGARVIKIEREEGDFARRYDTSVGGLSSYFVWLNRGKESICLDLKKGEDRAVVHAMLARSDIFVHNLAPGAVERLGFGEEAVRTVYPRLITCEISGYGTGSSYAHKKAYDLLIQCESGLVTATGSPDEPAKVGMSIADICAGMYAYSGILTALLVRASTGVGSAVNVAMLDAVAEWMSQPFLYSHYSQSLLGRSGPRHATIAPYGPFAVCDGTIYLAIQNEREWRRLCVDVLARADLVDDERFATNPSRVAHEAELRAAIEEAFATCTVADLGRRLDEYEIANAVLRSVLDLAEHPALVERARWGSVTTPSGEVAALLPPVTITGTAPVMGTVPEVGADSERLRAEFALPA